MGSSSLQESEGKCVSAQGKEATQHKVAQEW